MGYTPRVVVAGGGVTGAGIARDLAMRGLDVTLVERGSLANGTTGRMHGLLHSGARYATDDPDTAATCLTESRILREVAGGCVLDRGGLFVERPEDSTAYFEEKRSACRSIGMEVRELTGAEARELEPGLSPDVERALVVPDGTIDPFALTRATVESAMAHGATVRTRTEVVDLPTSGGAVEGVRVRDRSAASGAEPGSGGGASAGAQETIDADYVVNATGPWADEFASLAGLSAPIRLSKGAMVVMDGRSVSRVVNRCRPRQEGDIAVPFHSNCVLGTTDVEVDDPDGFSRPVEAVDRLIDELAAVVPAVETGRALRAYWGVRPLVDDGLDAAASGQPDGTDSSDAIDASRGYAVVDHERREGTWGISTVVGGKLTTHRRVAEAVADHVCEKFGIGRGCETAETPLPGSDREDTPDRQISRFGLDPTDSGRSLARPGSRAESVQADRDPNPVLCPCEGVTRAEVRAARSDEPDPACDLSTIPALTRAAMGSCQGGRCVQPVANQLHPSRPAEDVRRAQRELLRDRWPGQRPALWGEQLRTVMGTYAHLGTTLDLDATRDRDVADADRPADPDWTAFDAGPPDAGATPEGEES